jgi:hypothetical protein
MNNEIALGETIPLPVPPTGWFDYGYAVLWNGNLALVRSDRDIHAEYGRWRAIVRGGDIRAHQPNLQDVRIRLSTFDGSAESGAIEMSAGLWPKVDRLADGRWLVASSRTAPNENNARLYAADGTPAGTFAMGDGVEHICCAADGTIWVGYFDEGVFSGPNEDGSWPISSSGIARFGPDGSVLWKFNSAERADLSIADCYALALDGNTLWCCPYTGFPIVRVEGGVVDHWRNEVAGAKALAIDGDHVLLAGGYKDKSERIALLRLSGDLAQQIGEWRFRTPARDAAQLLQGRGATLHIVGHGRWTKVSLATLRAARVRRRSGRSESSASLRAKRSNPV